MFCHAQQHQSKLCVLGVELPGEKLHSFLLKNPVTSWCVIDSELVACCEVGCVITAPISLLFLSVASQKGCALSSHDLI